MATTAVKATLVSVLLTSIFVVLHGASVRAQSYPLSAVEIRLELAGGDGCVERCLAHNITLRGDGTVEYKGTGKVEGFRTKSVPIDDVIALANAFLDRHFFNALDAYKGQGSRLVRSGGMVTLDGSGSGTGRHIDLTLRIGDREKTVSFYDNDPTDLGKLAERVERLGGPDVWRGDD